MSNETGISIDQRLQLVKALAERLIELEGCRVLIIESLTHNRRRGYDRHATVINRFEMEVKRTGWQMSGGHVYLYDEEAQYGIFPGQISQIEFEEETITIYERFEEQTERKSVIRVLS